MFNNIQNLLEEGIGDNKATALKSFKTFSEVCQTFSKCPQKFLTTPAFENTPKFQFPSTFQPSKFENTSKIQFPSIFQHSKFENASKFQITSPFQTSNPTRPHSKTPPMHWRLEICFSIFGWFFEGVSWINAILSFYSGCVYFEIWRAYDILLRIIHLCMAVHFDWFRQEDTYVATWFFFHALCCERKTCREAHDVVFLPDFEEYKPKVFAIRVGFSVLFIRIAIAFFRGALNHATIQYASGYGHFEAILFIVTIIIDFIIISFSAVFAFCNQFRLCCKLGCKKYPLWLASVAVIVYVGMELPMQVLYEHLDRTWCCFSANFTAECEIPEDA